MWTRLILTICYGLVLWVHPAAAEETSLVRAIGFKFVRGVGNFVLGWMEIPKQIYKVGQEEGWVKGALRGPFDGVGMSIARMTAGAYEILTFPVPVPPYYQALLRPDFVWEAEPAEAPASSLRPKPAVLP
jgi:putative exosortase-associated protein (TIGR04073 family)